MQKGGGAVKKVWGIISNIVSALLIYPVYLYLFFLGLMFISFTGFDWSVSRIFTIISGASFMCALPACIVGIILSVIFRAKDKYKASYLIQLLPFVMVLQGAFTFVISILWGNT